MFLETKNSNKSALDIHKRVSIKLLDYDFKALYRWFKKCDKKINFMQDDFVSKKNNAI